MRGRMYHKTQRRSPYSLLLILVNLRLERRLQWLSLIRLGSRRPLLQDGVLCNSSQTASRLFVSLSHICTPVHLSHGFSFSMVMEEMVSPYSCIFYGRTVVSVFARKNGSMCERCHTRNWKPSCNTQEVWRVFLRPS